MSLRFERHYTREEAQAALPWVIQVLPRARHHRDRLISLQTRVDQISSGGAEVGGESVNDLMRETAAFQGILGEFQKRQIFIKDLDRGLLDFPALVGGREVFLCWEEGEPTVEFWHDLDSGYAGREAL